MIDAIEFIAVIQRNDRGEYTSSFPDFPGCNAFAPTEDEAIDEAADALADQLEEMRQAGKAIPIPSAFITILKNPEMARRPGDTRAAGRPARQSPFSIARQDRRYGRRVNCRRRGYRSAGIDLRDWLTDFGFLGTCDESQGVNWPDDVISVHGSR